MAIVRVIEPNVPPTETADWGRMLELIRSLELRAGDSNIVDWPSLTIKKSAVFFLGGTVYQADADTTISGTASSFVKLTPSGDGSVCTASYVTSLTGVSWNTTYNGWYDSSGNLYVFQAALPDRPHMARFESSGTFVVPIGIDTIYISGCAAGGNGGAGYSGSSTGAGGGGGGGECAVKVPTPVTPGSTITITLGSVGNNTTVGSGFLLNCGKNGENGNSVDGVGGIGGIGGSGNVNISNNGGRGQQNGYNGIGGGGYSSSVATYCGGGGGGGYYGIGTNGVNGSSGIVGGIAQCGGGGGGAGGTAGSGGGGGYGGGGGGGGRGNPTGGSGGAGGPALIIIEW